MKVIMACALLAMVFCFGAQVMAENSQGSVKSAIPAVSNTEKAPLEAVGDPMTDDSPEESLDDRMGAGTSGRLAAQGTVGYDDNTGLMNVVPSDSEGDIED